MKKAILILCFLLVCNFDSFCQKLPVLISGGNDDDYGNSDWRYQNYVFASYTPPIARPFTTTNIYRIVNGRRLEIKKSDLFNTDVTNMINDKMQNQYLVDKSENPACFQEKYSSIEIDNMEIYVDEKNMYFSFLWSHNWNDILDGKTECSLVHSISTISFPIIEIEKYIRLNK